MVQDLPGVGENLQVRCSLSKLVSMYSRIVQEHLFVGVQWQVKPEVRTFGELTCALTVFYRCEAT